MKSWNHQIEKAEIAPSWSSCNGFVKASPGSPFANTRGLERCQGPAVYRASYQYVTGKRGNVTTRILYFCAEHAKAWALKHGIGWDLVSNEPYCPACKELYGDDGVCDQGKPPCSPHRKSPEQIEQHRKLLEERECNCDQPGQVQCDKHGPRE